MLVRPDVADPILTAQQSGSAGGGDDGDKPDPDGTTGGGTQPLPTPEKATTRFHGTVSVDPNRAARDFGQVSEEVLTHLVSQVGTDVEVTVTIRATKPEGFDDKTVRDVTENARTLKFDAGSGFSES